MTQPVYSAGGFASKEDAIAAAKAKIDEVVAKEKTTKKRQPENNK